MAVYALDFNFTDRDYCERSADTQLTLNNTDFTIEFWVYPRQTGAANDAISAILSKETWPSTGCWSIYFGVYGNGAYSDRITFLRGNTWVEYTSDSDITTNAWHHIAYTYDLSEQELKLYIDGALDKTFTNIVTPDNQSNALYFGTRMGRTDWGMDGKLDEIRISDVIRYTSNFTPKTTKFKVDGNTLALWHLDEGTGTKVYDETDNDNDLDFASSPHAPSWVTGYIQNPAKGFMRPSDYW